MSKGEEAIEYGRSTSFASPLRPSVSRPICVAGSGTTPRVAYCPGLKSGTPASGLSRTTASSSVRSSRPVTVAFSSISASRNNASRNISASCNDA